MKPDHADQSSANTGLSVSASGQRSIRRLTEAETELTAIRH